MTHMRSMRCCAWLRARAQSQTHHSVRHSGACRLGSLAAAGRAQRRARSAPVIQSIRTRKHFIKFPPPALPAVSCPENATLPIDGIARVGSFRASFPEYRWHSSAYRRSRECS